MIDEKMLAWNVTASSPAIDGVGAVARQPLLEELFCDAPFELVPALVDLTGGDVDPVEDLDARGVRQPSTTARPRAGSAKNVHERR